MESGSTPCDQLTLYSSIILFVLFVISEIVGALHPETLKEGSIIQIILNSMMNGIKKVFLSKFSDVTKEISVPAPESPTGVS